MEEKKEDLLKNLKKVNAICGEIDDLKSKVKEAKSKVSALGKKISVKEKSLKEQLEKAKAEAEAENEAKAVTPEVNETVAEEAEVKEAEVKEVKEEKKTKKTKTNASEETAPQIEPEVKEAEKITEKSAETETKVKSEKKTSGKKSEPKAEEKAEEKVAAVTEEPVKDEKASKTDKPEKVVKTEKAGKTEAKAEEKPAKEAVKPVKEEEKPAEQPVKPVEKPVLDEKAIKEARKRALEEAQARALAEARAKILEQKRKEAIARGEDPSLVKLASERPRVYEPKKDQRPARREYIPQDGRRPAGAGTRTPSDRPFANRNGAKPGTLGGAKKAVEISYVPKDTGKAFGNKKKSSEKSYDDKKGLNKKSLAKAQVSIEDFDENKTGYRKARNKIATKLENQNTSLEECIELYEKGVQLSKTCTELLQKAQSKLTLLKDGKEENFEDKI